MTDFRQDEGTRRALCDTLSLGVSTETPRPVAGGFHHQMWELKTSSGRYAVKQLATDVNLADRRVRQHYEASEAVSRAFAQRGIPALTSLTVDNCSVQLIGDRGYLVYPWTSAAALQRSQINATHVQQVAAIFAALHNADFNIDGLACSDPVVATEENLQILIASARKRNSSRASELHDSLSLFEGIIARHRGAVLTLAERSVISHGDLDHKNILWRSSTSPILIDWESARYLNPAHEVILEALDWSGITMDFNQQLFSDFITAYQAAGGQVYAEEVEAAFDCVLGDWINWLLYNLGRSINVGDERERAIGLQQVDLSLVTIAHLQRLIPELLPLLISTPGTHR